jgi:hypothetical protein
MRAQAVARTDRGPLAAAGQACVGTTPAHPRQRPAELRSSPNLLRRARERQPADVLGERWRREGWKPHPPTVVAQRRAECGKPPRSSKLQQETREVKGAAACIPGAATTYAVWVVAGSHGGHEVDAAGLVAAKAGDRDEVGVGVEQALVVLDLPRTAVAGGGAAGSRCLWPPRPPTQVRRGQAAHLAQIAASAPGRRACRARWRVPRRFSIQSCCRTARSRCLGGRVGGGGERGSPPRRANFWGASARRAVPWQGRQAIRRAGR